MGILANTKQYLAKKCSSLASGAADGIAAASRLSPRQIAEIEEKRRSYLAQMPDMDGERAQEAAQRNLGALAIEIYQEYLAQMKAFYRPVDLAAINFDALNRIRYFDITKWVTTPDEQNMEKLVNVYHVLNAERCNIALIYHRTVENCTVTLAVANTDPDQTDPAEADAYLDRILQAVKGNFPGVELRQGTASDAFGRGIPEYLRPLAGEDGESVRPQSIAVVSNLPSDRSRDFISQGIEKLLDGTVPSNEGEEYTAVLLASPVLNVGEKRSRLMDISSVLSPFLSYQSSSTFTETDAQNASANAGAHLGAHAGGQASQSTTNSSSHKVLSQNEEIDEKTGGAKDKFWGSVGKSIMEGVGVLSRPMESTGENNGYGFQAGVNFGVSFSRASNISKQYGINKGISQTYTNFAIKHAMEAADLQIKRFDEGSALGMWDFSAYFISQSPRKAEDAAHAYFSLTQGGSSHMVSAAINLWDGAREPEDTAAVLESVRKLQHPVFALNAVNSERLMYPTLVTPSVSITGGELAKAMNLPRKSVSGLPVMESVAFGREVHMYESAALPGREIVLGRIQHMGRDESTPVTLDMDSLTSHVFITGSTGSGKSNTVYEILDKLRERGVRFLVVEPAKGEYKKVFGGSSAVYGTNPRLSELLRINPFSFPDSITVSEHIDRLAEIFNACWPMYAAMPAILKDAIGKAYENAGWDLDRSASVTKRFPTLMELTRTLPEVLNSSLYSGDTKSDYSGALITRVNSLTNGTAGQILCGTREMTYGELFDRDVIVDLSRVGSAETRSLLMGLLVMKLQEYRIHLDRTNSELVHVTVLEEAHNLLRRTSTAQFQESANLQGQAVKMLTDSLAEMRTYGEGFIIADQAPGLLDEAVIRNTNTKIVLRLPELSDRQAVGASMAMSEKQIQELARLPRGVAAVYQNEWAEPVLCRIERFPDSKISPLKYVPKDDTGRETFVHFFNKVFGIRDDYEMSEEDVDTVREWMGRLHNSRETIDTLESALSGRPLTEKQRESVAYSLFGGQKIARTLYREKDPKAGIEAAAKKITSFMSLNDELLTATVRRYIMQAIFHEDSGRSLAQRYMEFLDDGRVK